MKIQRPEIKVQLALSRSKLKQESEIGFSKTFDALQSTTPQSSDYYEHRLLKASWHVYVIEPIGDIAEVEPAVHRCDTPTDLPLP
jgi:hypothetical protein